MPEPRLPRLFILITILLVLLILLDVFACASLATKLGMMVQ